MTAARRPPPERRAAPPARRGGQPGVVPGWALAAGLVPLAALVLEYAGSVLGSGPSSWYPGWLVAVAWPQPVRIVWWLAAAAGAWALTRGLAHANGRRGWLLSVVVTAPFAVFAVGIAAGTQWTAWH